MKSYFSIGEMSKIHNVSIQALRYYDKIGLLKPSFIDENNSYRYYELNQFVDLDIIKFAKATGIPLKKISKIMETKKLDSIQELLVDIQKDIENSIIKLSNLNTEISSLSSKINQSKKINKNNDIYFRQIEERLILMEKIKDVTISDKDIEIKLRELEGKITNSLIYNWESGIIYNSNLFNENKLELESIYIYTDFKEKNDFNIDVLPKGNYLCIAYQDKDEDIAMDKVFKYLKQNNLIIDKAIRSYLFDNLNVISYELQILLR